MLTNQPSKTANSQQKQIDPIINGTTSQQVQQNQTDCLKKQIGNSESISDDYRNVANIFSSLNQQKNKAQTDPQLTQLKVQQLNIVDIADEKFKNHEQLKSEFEQNQKKLENLSDDISNLFKKISSLTQSITNIDDLKIQSSNTIIQQNNNNEFKWKSETLIPNRFNQINAKLATQQKQLQIEAQIQQKKHTSSETHTQLEEVKGISMKMFQTGKRLGYGKFGEVLECRHKETGVLYALKKIFKSTIEKYEMQQQMCTQLEACSIMTHPNIMRSYAAFTDEFHVFLLCEYLSGTRLTKKFNAPEKEVGNIILQVLQAVKYMHCNGIVHRDLKPQNIMIQLSGVIKICDFGWSSNMNKQSRMQILCGTLDYVCPEMVSNEQYHKQVDLWSIGVLAYQLIYGQAPFKEVDRTSTFERVKKIDINFPSSPQISQGCQKFIRKLLKPENQRMTIEEAFNSQFIQSIQNKLQVSQNIDNDITNLFA